jgi:hypothetical protein
LARTLDLSLAMRIVPTLVKGYSPSSPHHRELTPSGRRRRTTRDGAARNRTLNLKVLEGPIPFSVNQDFEDLGGSTKITVVGEGEPGRLFKLAEPVVGKVAERQLKADFETLKDLLEARQ